MIKKTLWALLALTLCGCATPYQSLGFAGGYSETQLGDRVFRVSYAGNPNTRAETVADYAMLRSAELTLLHGYRFFVITDSSDYYQTTTSSSPQKTQTLTTVHGSGAHAHAHTTTTTTGGNVKVTNKPLSTQTIVLFESEPEINGIVYDAEFLLNSIRAKYNLVQDK